MDNNHDIRFRRPSPEDNEPVSILLIGSKYHISVERGHIPVRGRLDQKVLAFLLRHNVTFECRPGTNRLHCIAQMPRSLAELFVELLKINCQGREGTGEQCAQPSPVDGSYLCVRHRFRNAQLYAN